MLKVANVINITFSGFGVWKEIQINNPPTKDFEVIENSSLSKISTKSAHVPNINLNILYILV